MTKCTFLVLIIESFVSLDSVLLLLSRVKLSNVLIVALIRVTKFNQHNTGSSQNGGIRTQTTNTLQRADVNNMEN